MKNYSTLILLTIILPKAPLHASNQLALPAPTAPEGHGVYLDDGESFGFDFGEQLSPNQLAIEPYQPTTNVQELLSAQQQHSKRRILKGAVLTSTAAGTLYVLSKVPFVQRLFPSVFSRSGTSNAVLYGVLGILATGGGWIAWDYIKSMVHMNRASEDFANASDEINRLKGMVEQLTKSYEQQAEINEELSHKIASALESAKKARESMESAEGSVQQLVDNIKGDWSNVAHRKEVSKLKERVSNLENIIKKMGIKTVNPTSDEYDLETLLDNANNLGEAADNFLRNNQPQSEPARLEVPTAPFESQRQQSDTTHNRKKYWWFSRSSSSK